MIQDNPATKGSDATHQMSQSEYALVQNLTVLYGEGGASYLAKRIMAIAMGELMARPAEHADPKPLSAADYVYLWRQCAMNLACR